MKIITPKGQKTRPTSSKVRAAVMDSIGEEIKGCCFFDFFAGSGVMGIEALSRGAKRCVFVEQDKQALISLKKNLQTLHQRIEKSEDLGTPDITLLRGDLSGFWKKLREYSPAEFIWADPPYADWQYWLNEFHKNLLNHSHYDTQFIWENQAKLMGQLNFPEGNLWDKCSERKYGDSAVYKWRRIKEDHEQR